MVIDLAGLTRFVRSDDAVSPVIAMVLILFIVTTAIGVVYISGLPRIESAKEGAHMQNMKSVFIVLQGDIKEVAQAPSTTGQARVTKMNMDKGSLYIYNASEENGTGYIEYSSGDQIISYENGAVFMRYSYQDYAEIISDPMMYVIVDEDDITHVHIHGITVRGIDTGGSVGGSGSVQIRLKRGNVTESEEMSMNEVTFVVEDSMFYRGWYDYFDNMLEKSDLDDTANEYDITKDEATKTTTVKIVGKDDTSSHDVIVYYKETEVIAQL